MSIVRRWWPIPVLLASSIVVQRVLVESRYDVSGHATGHLQSATVVFPAVVIVATLLYATPLARRQPLVLVPCAMWLLSTVLVFVGNIRVVDALVDAGLADTPTSQLVMTKTLESAHDLADLAPWFGVVSSLAVTAALWRYGHISVRVAVGAALLSLIFPPWFFPGAGMLVITIARCIAFQREASHSGRSADAPSLTEISS
jgi:hypothetical protein